MTYYLLLYMKKQTNLNSDGEQIQQQKATLWRFPSQVLPNPIVLKSNPSSDLERSSPLKSRKKATLAEHLVLLLRIESDT